MTFEAYINPDFGLKEKLIFFGAALFGVLLCVIFILLGEGIGVSRLKKRERRIRFYERGHNRVQRFYELIIAGTSVMSFSCAYVILNHIHNLIESGAGTPGPVLEIIMNAWAEGRDFVLLLLICLSCVLNSILDKIFIPLKRLAKEEKAMIRMLAMFYVIIILIYLNNIGDASEYNPVMMYYLGLMVGRFVYFDASFRDFLTSLKNMFLNLPLLILCLALSWGLSSFGFNSGYLLERNYFIVGAFYTHLFMLAVVFVLKLSHVLEIVIRKPAGYDEYIAAEDEAAHAKNDNEVDPWEEEYEYDDYGDDYSDPSGKEDSGHDE